ncbi:MAG: hypothetical protein ACI959_002152, partial [Limisphaerales bacterium]
SLSIQESFSGSEEDFIQVSKLALRFNAVDLISRKYTVRRITISDGYIKLRRKKNGQVNYQFWKPATDTTTKPLNLVLDKLEIQRIKLEWIDEDANQEASVFIASADASGSFEPSKYNLSLNSTFTPEALQLSGRSYPSGHTLTLETKLQSGTEEGEIEILKALVLLNENRFGVTGSLFTGKQPRIDLKLEGQRLKIEELMLLAAQMNPYTEKEAFGFGWNSKGTMGLTGSIIGPLSGPKKPALDLVFALAQGSLSNQDLGLNLSGLSFNGSLKTAKGLSDIRPEFSIENLVAEQNGEALRLDLSITNPKDPEIKFKADGRIAISSLLPLLNRSGNSDPLFTKPAGHIELKEVNISGKITDLKSGKKTTSDGIIIFDHAGLSWNGTPYLIPDGQAVLKADELKVNELVILSGDKNNRTKGTLDLGIRNIAAWLLLEGPDRPIPVVQGKADFESFDLYQLIRDAGPVRTIKSKKEVNNAAPINKADVAKRRGFILPAIHGKIELTIKTFKYRDLILENLTAPFELSPGYYHTPELSAQGMEGKVNLKTSLRQSNSGMLNLQVSGNLDGLLVQEVFREFEDFGQKELTQSHLKGTLYGQLLSLNATWNKALILQQDQLLAEFELEIIDGELIKYEPLNSLSGFIKVDELEHIRFSNLKNKISIKNQRINIPTMQINSSAINIALNGHHGFDNTIDYDVKVNLLDVLQNKFRKKANSSFVEEAKEGGLNIYLSMKGKTSDPDISYNKREAKDAFRDRDSNLFESDRIKNDDKSNSDPENVEELEFIDWDENQ